MLAVNVGIRRYNMAEATLQTNRDNLIAFFDFAADKGLMNKNTATAYKKASSVILKILDESEAADISRIDLEEVIRRHRNLAAGKIPPMTLKTYEIRVRAAVNNFIQYTKDPSSWKPIVKERTRKTPAVKTAKTIVSATQSQKFEKAGQILGQPSVYIDFQIHISPETTEKQIDQIFASMKRHLYGSIADK
jgi:hypothetical protein